MCFIPKLCYCFRLFGHLCCCILCTLYFCTLGLDKLRHFVWILCHVRELEICPFSSASFFCREPVWGILPVTRSWGRKLTYARRAQTFPLEIPKHVPQQKFANFVLCFSILLTLSGKSQFRALVFCIWKSVSIQKPLWMLSSLPAGLVQLACDCLRPPFPRRHRKLKAS